MACFPLEGGGSELEVSQMSLVRELNPDPKVQTVRQSPVLLGFSRLICSENLVKNI